MFAGLAFCALMSTLAGRDKLDFDIMGDKNDRAKCFERAFAVAEGCGVLRMLDVADMVRLERPDKYSVMLYLSEIYKAFK